MIWNLSVKDGIGTLEINVPDTEVNVLSSEALGELKNILIEIPQRPELKILLITSAKKRIFIAGADIKEIRGISDESDAYEKAEQGKKVFELLEDLRVPTVTVINGACLGGGLELALATDFRVASFSKNVLIGLPEVNLGILPGFGGSIRLPRLLGLMKAMPLILAGKMLPPDKALKEGIVDRLYHEKTLLEDARGFAGEILEKGVDKIRKKKKKKSMIWFFEDTAIGRGIVFDQARKGVLKKTKGFYPAPLEIIELLKKTYADKSLSAYTLESKHFAKLGATEVSKNCIHLFFLNEQYKKKAWSESKVPDFKVKKCGVIGAGVMGGGIAQRVAYRNIPVRVKDINEQALAGALKEAMSIFKGAVKRRRMKKSQADFQMGLISVGLTNEGLQKCDIIIEAVVENLDIKKKVFAELDQVTPATAVLASNTSALPVTEMAAVCKHPERVVGLHFFNPVNRMPLVEVIRGEKTSDETLEKTIQFSRKLGKTVIVTKDAPGFLVNRLLLPYLNEAAYLLEQGMSLEVVDRIAKKFGMPMGPVELIDQVGVDVGYKVAQYLESALGPRMKVASVLNKVYDKKFLGKKTGKGFYVYQGKKKTMNKAIEFCQKGAKPPASEEALKRMTYIMINEAARCLDEQVVDSAATIDIGMIFGTGFPPFRGGLLKYADSLGLENVLADIKQLGQSVSQERFEPAPYLERLVTEKKTFYAN